MFIVICYSDGCSYHAGALWVKQKKRWENWSSLRIRFNSFLMLLYFHICCQTSLSPFIHSRLLTPGLSIFSVRTSQTGNILEIIMGRSIRLTIKQASVRSFIRWWIASSASDGATYILQLVRVGKFIHMFLFRAPFYFESLV